MADFTRRLKQVVSMLSRQAHQILGVAAMLIACLWLFLVLSVQEERATEVLESRQSNLSLALAHQQRASSALQLLDQALLLLRDDYTRTHKAPSIEQRLDALQIDRKYLGIVSLIGPDGWPIATTHSEITHNYADREYFKFHAVEQEDSLLVGHPVIGRLTGKWVITLTRRINKPDGSFGGVIFASLNPDFFAAETNDVDLGIHAAVALIGLDGITLVRRNNGVLSYGENINSSQLFKELPHSPSGSYVAKAASDGTLRIVGYSVMPRYPLVVIVGSSMNDVMLKLHPIERHTWIAGGLLTLLIAALAYVLISRDIHSQRSMELLERSESRQRAIVEMLPIPIALSNNGVGVTFVNAAFTDTFGYSQQDIPTVERWREMAFPDPEYRSKVIQEWRIGLRHAEESAGIFGPQQLNIRCKDGADKTVLGLVTPLSFALHGEKLTVYHDITKEVQATKALQRALKDNVGLLNEVHHRVKNNLQVITSLLRLEASRSNKEEVRSVLQDMQGRIRSMSLLHESLYRSGQFAHVHLAAYLTQLVSLAMRAFMSNEGGVQVRMDMSPLEVALDRATPLGLLLNELLSNCMKHAFPDGAGGEIHISLSPVEGTPSIWLLRVRDTGVGLASAVEPGRSQSMGLQLVFDLAEQIGGKATLQNATGGGAEFAMRFESCARSTDGVAL